MASTAIAVLDNLIREELPSTINESLPDIAPVYKYIQQTSMDVKRDDIGRQWKVIHIYDCGVAGLIQHADPNGPATLTNTNYPQTDFLDSSSAALTPFPSAVASPHAGSLKRVLSLHRSTGNFSIPVTWLQADALSASQIAQVAREIKAVGELRALTEAQSFFMASNNTLAQIDNFDNSGVASGYFTFTVKAGTGRTQFFRIGMMIDILADSSGPQFGTALDGTDVKNLAAGAATSVTTDRIDLVVADVDYINGTIKVASAAGTALSNMCSGSNINFADDDWVILRACNTASREMRTWGIEDWMKESGTIMADGGGNPTGAAVDLDTFSQFKSSVASVGAALTEHTMNRYIGGFLDAYPGSKLDTIITTMGVTISYVQQPGLGQNQLHWERQGEALKFASGWDELTYSFNGRRMNWMISPMAISKRLYATKFAGGNIKRYIPPRIGGSDTRVGSELEFLVPVAGGSSIFKIAHASSGASQDMLEAPFWQYCLIAPIDVKGVKLTDITEAVLS